MIRKVLKSEYLYVKTYKVMCCSHFVRIKLTARMTEKWEVCMSVSTEARHIRNSSALPLFTRDHFKTRSQALIAHCGMSEIYHQTPPLRRPQGRRHHGCSGCICTRKFPATGTLHPSWWRIVLKVALATLLTVPWHCPWESYCKTTTKSAFLHKISPDHL